MMTQEEIVDVLSKARFNPKTGDATNLEYKEKVNWIPWFMGFEATMRLILDGVIVRIKDEPKVRPYEAKDWLMFLNKMWLTKVNEPVLILAFNDKRIYFGGKIENFGSTLCSCSYDWAFENLTDPVGHPFGEIE